MSVSSRYSQEISQTALALLALVAAGKPLDSATVQILQTLVDHRTDQGDRVELTVFSDSDETELPVILPFMEADQKKRVYYNSYGAVQLRDETPYENGPSRLADRHTMTPRLRVYSPDAACEAEANESPCPTHNGHFLRIYAE